MPSQPQILFLSSLEPQIHCLFAQAAAESEARAQSQKRHAQQQLQNHLQQLEQAEAQQQAICSNNARILELETLVREAELAAVEQVTAV